MIVGVDWSIKAQDLDTVGDEMSAQLSFLTTSQHTTNDARGVISNIGMYANNTEGTPTNPIIASQQKYINMGDDGIDVSGGERLYIHTIFSSGVAGEVHCVVHFSFKRAPARRARRRR